MYVFVDRNCGEYMEAGVWCVVCVCVRTQQTLMGMGENKRASV